MDACSGWCFNHTITLSDVASSLGFLLALYATVTWRSQKTLEKRAEIASRALAEMTRMALFLRARTMDLSSPDLEKMSPPNLIHNWGDLDAIRDEYELARVYLKAHMPSQSLVMDELRVYALDLWNGQNDQATNAARFSDLYGDKPDREIIAILDKAIRVLSRPIAHKTLDPLSDEQVVGTLGMVMLIVFVLIRACG